MRLAIAFVVCFSVTGPAMAAPSASNIRIAYASPVVIAPDQALDTVRAVLDERRAAFGLETPTAAPLTSATVQHRVTAHTMFIGFAETVIDGFRRAADPLRQPTLGADLALILDNYRSAAADDIRHILSTPTSAADAWLVLSRAGTQTEISAARLIAQAPGDRHELATLVDQITLLAARGHASLQAADILRDQLVINDSSAILRSSQLR